MQELLPGELVIEMGDVGIAVIHDAGPAVAVSRGCYADSLTATRSCMGTRIFPRSNSTRERGS